MLRIIVRRPQPTRWERSRRPVVARRAVPAPLAVAGGPATSVGILGGPGTMISAVPADLNAGAHVDIAAFTVLALDAGEYT